MLHAKHTRNNSLNQSNSARKRCLPPDRTVFGQASNAFAYCRARSLDRLDSAARYRVRTWNWSGAWLGSIGCASVALGLCPVFTGSALALLCRRTGMSVVRRRALPVPISIHSRRHRPQDPYRRPRLTPERHHGFLAPWPCCRTSSRSTAISSNTSVLPPIQRTVIRSTCFRGPRPKCSREP